MHARQNIPLPQLQETPAYDPNHIEPAVEGRQCADEPNVQDNWNFFARYKVPIVGVIVLIAIFTFLITLITTASFSSAHAEQTVDKKCRDVTKEFALEELEKRIGQQNPSLSMEGQLSKDVLEAMIKEVFNVYPENGIKRFKRKTERELDNCKQTKEDCRNIFKSMHEKLTTIKDETICIQELLNQIGISSEMDSPSADLVLQNVLRCLKCGELMTENSTPFFDDIGSSDLVPSTNSNIESTIKNSQAKSTSQHIIDTFFRNSKPDSFDTSTATADVTKIDSSVFKVEHDSSDKHIVYSEEPSKTQHFTYHPEGSLTTEKQFAQNVKNIIDVIRTDFSKVTNYPNVAHTIKNVSTSESRPTITKLTKTIQPTASTSTKIQASQQQQESQTIFYGKTQTRPTTVKSTLHQFLPNARKTANTTDQIKAQINHERITTTPITMINTMRTTEATKNYNITEISNFTSMHTDSLPEQYNDNANTTTTVENVSHVLLNSAEARVANRPEPSSVIMLKNQLKGNVDFNSIAIPTSETMTTTHQLQYVPRINFIPRSVCFYGPPFPTTYNQIATGNMFSAPSSPAASYSITSPQFLNGQSFLYPMNQPQIFPPNNIPAQGQSAVRYIPQEYQSNPASMLPQQVGPTGPGVQNLLLNQGRRLPTNLPYYCTYVSTPTLQFSAAPGMSEFERTVPEISKSNSKEPTLETHGTQSRQGLTYIDDIPRCPANFYQCADDNYCVSKLEWCDGTVDCPDASDETKCSCRDRVDKERLCDGYFDCPQGEDELGCFGCNKHSFSCDDWNKRYRRENCVPLVYRCDGFKHCANGKDEMDCNILTHTVQEGNSFIVGYTEGYLHKNWRGRWYPVCIPSISWATEACVSETGLHTRETPIIQSKLISEDIYEGPYLEFDSGEIKEVTSCYNKATFVKCLPIPCGTRVLSHNRLYSQYYYEDINEESTNSEPISFDFQKANILRSIKNKSKTDSQVNNQNNTIVGSESRVVGGRASEPRAWPFLVAVNRNGDFHCGGTIINKYWILTAAHCVYNYHEYYYEIQAGILRRFSFSPMGQSRRVINIIVYKEYNKKTMSNDLAMMKLDEGLHFNRWVRPACLPEITIADSVWKLNSPSEIFCAIVGWGATKEHGPDPDHLREVEVPILPYCKHRVDRNDAEICAGIPQGGTDACQGDSGGPLMCRNTNSPTEWYVAGIVSHGEGCGRPNEPGVYTKVSRFVEWIELIIDGSEIFSQTPLDGCPGFNCKSGLRQCVSNNRVCDKIVDCLNAEDELNCNYDSMLKEFNLDRSKIIGSNLSTWTGMRQEQLNISTTDDVDPTMILVTDTPSVPRTSTNDSSFDYSSEKISKIIDQVRTNILQHRENITDELPKNDLLLTSTKSSTAILHFTCKILMQNILIDKHCDGIIDCEDGTDEKNCTCRDYLSNIRPAAICDGHIDCRDKSDEENCVICNESEFRCKRSGSCIPLKKRCDNYYNCPLNEDEEDCFSLTNGEYIYMDLDGRPDLNVEGILTQYEDNKWHPLCYYNRTSNESVEDFIGQNICENIGFGGLESIRKTSVRDTFMEVKSSLRNNVHHYENSSKYVVPSDGNETCDGLYIRCRTGIKGDINRYLIYSPKSENRTYLWPWHAAIFVDGQYICVAVLLDPKWLLTNFHCMENVNSNRNYTTALLGLSRSYHQVDGPYQQIVPIDEIKYLRESDAVLLHLKKPINVTRHVQPIFNQKRIYPPTEEDICVAVGVDKNLHTKTKFLNTVVQCPNCHRCYKSKFPEECTNDTSIPWSGTIVCLGSGGWYPAGIFYEKNGTCSIHDMQVSMNIDHLNPRIIQAMEDAPSPFNEPQCDGFRCHLGQCITWNRVCDGIPDCRDAADEDIDYCGQFKDQCYHSNFSMIGCKCNRSELRCGNGQCVPKQSYCDGHVDCDDGTDEPAKCTCASYLELTTPERLCDGRRHCFDKSDESYETCYCKDASFKCDSGINEKEICIPQDFVCDDQLDCPSGDDEKQCRTVKGSLKDPPGTGEVIKKSYGVWHSECFANPVTSETEASDICKDLGYSSGIIVNDRSNVNLRPTIPRFDDFFMIKLNSQTWIGMRYDKPLVKLESPLKECHRLFVNCV